MILGKELWVGPRVRMGVFGQDDIQTITGWYQDAEFLRLYDATEALPKTEEQIARLVDGWQRQEGMLTFTVRLVDSNALVGLIHLEGIERNHGVASLSIALGPEYWNRGLGTEAMTLVMRYAFTEMNLHRLQLTVFEYNPRAQAVYRKLGFRHEGTFREFLSRDGRRWDMYLMGILADEWRMWNALPPVVAGTDNEQEAVK